MSTTRPEHLTIGKFAQPGGLGQSLSNPASASTSPNEPLSGGSTTLRSPFGIPPNSNLNPSVKMAAASRSAAGSPSHDPLAAPGSARFLPSKRAREIQAQEGLANLPVNLWGGPPTSGNSTPLRENIPESPTDGFPEFPQLASQDSLPSTRRARAGTLPSRLSTGPPPSNGLLSIPSLAYKTSRPSPSHSPFKTPSPGLEPTEPSNNPSALLSRLRAGSLPQRSPFPQHVPGTSSPFGPNIFSSSWNTVGRERGSTLASIASVSSNGPSSPTQSQLSREGGAENDVPTRTLDYLGLVGTPQPAPLQMEHPYRMPDFAQASRFRSYSVNHKDKYQDDDYDNDIEVGYEPESIQSQYEMIQHQLAATQAAINEHNAAVQALQSASRPRARTVGGVLDSPNPSRLVRGNYFPTPSRLDNSITAADLAGVEDLSLVDDLTPAVAAMNLGRSSSGNNGLLNADEPELGPTSALWLGSIPTSTTTTTLNEMFKRYGPIHFTRVLTHKNCGFVNFERIESAVSAKSELNGKEIFPGAGPVRINFAKPPSAAPTPGHDGTQPSPSPVPFNQGQNGSQFPATAASGEADAASGLATPTVPPLTDMTGDILEIVKQFGAKEEEVSRMSQNLQSAITYNTLVGEIPPIAEPTSSRVYDAPRLREIRKKIDNHSLPRAEVEHIAHDMLPEIVELSSDYLGNTVVQKLFETCSDATKDAMLEKVAPHLAEIGVHKNGTWAAQKIINMCRTDNQMRVIAEHLRPYTIPLFLDQYGNYVLQCCLGFGAPYTDFIFETMMSEMWQIAQGRFGSRGMRACLESHDASQDQQRLLAAVIALHSAQLATNPNSALLLTWFLDSCTFPRRRTVLAPQLVPFLVTLCTQKVAYLTVLKVINQKAEPEARDKIVQAMFFSKNDQTLESILRDAQNGATLIFKVITTPFFDEAVRSQVIENVKAVLLRIKAQSDRGYKRLMDEVGLSTRNGNSGGGGGGGARNEGHNERSRSSQRSSNNHQQQREHQQAQQQMQAQQAAAAHFNPSANASPYYSPLAAPSAGMSNNGFDSNLAIPRSDSVDPSLQQQYAGFAQGGMAPMGLPYQQNVLRGGAPMNGFYPIQNGVPFPSGSPSMDQYRSNSIPPPANQSPYAPPGYAVPMPMGMSGFGYAMPPPGYNMPEGAMNGSSSGRRGGRGGRNAGRNSSASPRPY